MQDLSEEGVVFNGWKIQFEALGDKDLAIRCVKVGNENIAEYVFRTKPEDSTCGPSKENNGISPRGKKRKETSNSHQTTKSPSKEKKEPLRGEVSDGGSEGGGEHYHQQGTYSLGKRAFPSSNGTLDNRQSKRPRKEKGSDEGEGRGSNFFILPEEVQLHIFQLLPPLEVVRKIPMVCRHWLKLSRDEILWQRLHRSYFGGPVFVSAPSPPTLLTPMPPLCGLNRNTNKDNPTLPNSATAVSRAPSWREESVKVLKCMKQLQDEYKTDLLVWAATCGYIQLVKSLLIDPHMDINAEATKSGEYEEETALYAASKRGNIKVVELLVEAGADVNALALNGSTPLIVAALKGQKSIVQYLLAHNADVKAMSSNGVTALYEASRKGHREVAAVLLEHGSNINAKTENGWTALTVAIYKGHKEMVQFLLDNNADVRSTLNDGRTAIDIANQREHHHIAELLKKHL